MRRLDSVPLVRGADVPSAGGGGPATLRAMRLSSLLPALAVLAAPAALAGDDTLVSDARGVIQTFRKKDPHIEKFFSSAVGYAVFPTIAKGGFVVGGAGGDGVLFVGG